MSANYSYPYTPPAAPPKRRNTVLIVTIITVIAILCCCVVVAGVIVIGDPFNWHIKDRLFGGTFDAAAEAMPEDTGFYVGFNLLGATPGDLDRVIQPFADSLQVKQRNWDDVLQELDKYFGEQINVTLTGDVKPWIGQYLGIGLFNIQLDNTDNPVSVVAAIESRDNSAADDFLQKLRDGMEQKNQATVNETKYQGVTIYSMQPDYGSGIAFCRSGSLVLFSLKADDLHTAIESQNGRSLADNSRYRDMIGKMPGKRIATVYFTSQEMANLIDEMSNQIGSVFSQLDQSLGGSAQAPQSPLTKLNLDQWDSMILSLEVTGAGIQMDVATSYNLDNLSAGQRQMLDNMGQTPKTIELFPEDTLGFVASQRLDLSYDTAIQSLRDVSPDMNSSVDKALQSVRDATGIDLDNDLFHLLDGEYALGLFPSLQGYLAKQGNIKLGIALLAESSDTGALANTMDTLASKLEEQGASVNRTQSGDLSLYEILQSAGGDVVFAGGIQQDYMSIATSSQAIEDLFSGNTPLSKSSRYRDAISPLPDGVAPMFYLDLEGLLGTIRESMPSDSRASFDQSVRMLEPIPYIVLGVSGLNGNVQRTTLIVHVK